MASRLAGTGGGLPIDARATADADEEFHSYGDKAATIPNPHAHTRPAHSRPTHSRPTHADGHPSAYAHPKPLHQSHRHTGSAPDG